MFAEVSGNEVQAHSTSVLSSPSSMHRLHALHSSTQSQPNITAASQQVCSAASLSLNPALPRSFPLAAAARTAAQQPCSTCH